MPTPPLNLPQQFGRFLLTGALVFALAFWLSTSILMNAHTAAQDRQALLLALKSYSRQNFSLWLVDVDRAYLPFFLSQRPLVVSYLLAAPLAWFAAFLYDTRILRKENLLGDRSRSCRSHTRITRIPRKENLL